MRVRPAGLVYGPSEKRYQYVVPAGQPRGVDVDGVGVIRPGRGGAGRDDRGERPRLGHLPRHVDRLGRHAAGAAGGQRVGGEAGPQDDRVLDWIARRHPEGERVPRRSGIDVVLVVAAAVVVADVAVVSDGGAGDSVERPTRCCPGRRPARRRPRRAAAGRNLRRLMGCTRPSWPRHGLGRRRSHVAGARPDDPVVRGLLEDVGAPADDPAGGEGRRGTDRGTPQASITTPA